MESTQRLMRGFLKFGNCGALGITNAGLSFCAQILLLAMLCKYNAVTWTDTNPRRRAVTFTWEHEGRRHRFSESTFKRARAELVAEGWITMHDIPECRAKEFRVVGGVNGCLDRIARIAQQAGDSSEHPEVGGQTAPNGGQTEGVPGEPINGSVGTARGSVGTAQGVLGEPLPIEVIEHEEVKEATNCVRGCVPDQGIQNPTSMSTKRFPLLTRWYRPFLREIATYCPNATVPERDTPSDHKWRAALAELIEKHGYSEQVVIGALEWVLTSDSKKAHYWRNGGKGWDFSTLTRIDSKGNDIKFWHIEHQYHGSFSDTEEG